MPFEELDLQDIKNQDKDIDEVAAKIEAYYKQDVADKLLRAYTWDEAIRFYDGDQHIEYNVSTNRFQQITVTRNNDFIPKPTTNYILPVVRTIVSQLTKQRPEAIVRPNSKDPRDIASAKLGDLALDVKNEELREDEKNQEKAYWGVITGTAFKKIFWDESGNKAIKIPQYEMVTENITDELGQPVQQMNELSQPMTDKMGQPIYQTRQVEKENGIKEYPIGDVNSAIITPFNIAFHLSARSPLELEWIMEYSIQKLGWIKRTYGKTEPGYTGKANEVSEEKDLSAVMQLEYRLRTLTGRRSGGHYATGSSGYIDIKNSAVVKEYYQKPNSEYPNGRMCVVANGRTLYDGDNPYYVEGVDDSWNPYVEWRFEIVPGRAWGKGLVEELIPINRRINAIDSLIILNRRTMAIPQWLLPDGCGVPNGYINGRPGLNIPYRPVGANGAKPEKTVPTPLPQQVYEERNQAVEDIKRLGTTNDVLEGVNPVGVYTAYQLQQLQENAVGSLAATFQRWEKSFEREETKKLLLISKRYKEPREEFGRKLKIMNKDITDIDIEMFMGEDLRDNVNVRIEPGSSIPRSKAAEDALLREMVQSQVLDVVTNPVNKREFMDKLGIKGFDYQSSPDVKRAQWENSIIEAGDMESLIVQQSQPIPQIPQIDPMTGQPVMDEITGMPVMTGGGMTPPQTVLELDDHETHIIIHSARMKDPNIIGEMRQNYLNHIEEHLQFLKTGAQAQRGAQLPPVQAEAMTEKMGNEGAVVAAQGGI